MLASACPRTIAQKIHPSPATSRPLRSEYLVPITTSEVSFERERIPGSVPLDLDRGGRGTLTTPSVLAALCPSCWFHPRRTWSRAATCMALSMATRIWPGPGSATGTSVISIESGPFGMRTTLPDMTLRCAPNSARWSVPPGRAEGGWSSTRSRPTACRSGNVGGLRRVRGLRTGGSSSGVRDRCPA